MTAARSAVIGLGNPYRRDDGVGPAVIDALRNLDLDGVRLNESVGEPADLLEAWTGAAVAIVVDAVRCTPPCPPGTIHRGSVDEVAAPSAATSTHAINLRDAVQLADVLGQQPPRVLVLAVEAGDVTMGLGLTPAVQAAVPALVADICSQLGAQT